MGEVVFAFRKARVSYSAHIQVQLQCHRRDPLIFGQHVL
jgi:hypothetical protein